MIGLLTPFRIHNYGTKLQAYSAQQVVSAYGETEVIDYIPSFADKLIHKPENLRNARFLDYKPTGASGDISPQLIQVRNQALDSFDQRLRCSHPLVGRHLLARHADHYAATVCGSDQIWNPVNLSRHVFMLDFVPKGTPRVAFSPSFGIDALPESLKPTYRRRLARMDNLSIRESSGADILHDLGFDEVTQTLDPTLMLTPDEWQALAMRPKEMNPHHEPYLFCYFLGTRQLGRSVAHQVAQARGLHVVNLPHVKGYCPHDDNLGDTQLYDVSPEGFVWLIAHAQAVCTDSFHGSAFALQFGKELYLCPRHEETEGASTNTRVYSLLEGFGMQSRIVRREEDFAETLHCPFDPHAVEATLEQQRQATRDYLSCALDGLA